MKTQFNTFECSICQDEDETQKTYIWVQRDTPEEKWWIRNGQPSMKK